MFIVLVLGGVLLLRDTKEVTVPSDQNSNTATYNGNNTAQIDSPTNNTVTARNPSPISQKFSVPTKDGSSLEVTRFLPPNITPSTAGDIYLAGEEVGEKDLYKIAFYAPKQSFSIILLQEPLQNSRLQAEQFLIQKLAITEQDACRLLYFVSVPASVNAFYAGRNLGFSFCPGAEVL